MSGHFRAPISSRVLRKIKLLSAPEENVIYMFNRNPRNLERLRIGYKPLGYHLEKPIRTYWHQLSLNISGRYVNASINHFDNGPVITASTSEWAIKRQLYKTNDTAAFINLARVLARRCIQSGIIEITNHIEPVSGSKTDKFLKTLEENDIILKEADNYCHPKPWDEYRQEKFWEILEEDIGEKEMIELDN